jgi:hypothetical protein
VLSGWTVGENCGDFLAGKTQWSAQAKVLVANVVANIARLALPDLRKIKAILTGVGVAISRKYSLAHGVASGLLGVGAARAWSMLRVLEGSAWRISAPEAASPETAPTSNPLAEPRAVLRALTREALASAVEGRPERDYERQVARDYLKGLPVGNKYHSQRFLKDVELLAMRCVRVAMATQLARPLTGLGKPSRFTIFFDKVTIKGGLYAAHETLLLIGISFAHFASGELLYRLAACPSAGVRGDGAHIRDLIKESLRESPLRIGGQRLSTGLAATGGDGAVAAGGLAARHSSTRAADLLWQDAHPGVPLQQTYWDMFHRIGVADVRALRKSAMAQEVVDIHQAMSALFGVGRGRVLLRSIAAELDMRGGVPGSSPVTREGVNAEKNAVDLVRFFFASIIRD